MDLRHSLIPEEVVEEMIKAMPSHEGPGDQDDKEQPKYDYVSFMEKLMGADKKGSRNGGGAR